jgi:hypothetical protein
MCAVGPARRPDMKSLARTFVAVVFVAVGHALRACL